MRSRYSTWNSISKRNLENGEGCLPCWGIAKCDSESDPFDVDPTPKHGWAIDFAFRWSLDENVDQGNDEWSSIALIEISGSVLLVKGSISSLGTHSQSTSFKDAAQNSGFDPKEET